MTLEGTRRHLGDMEVRTLKMIRGLTGCSQVLVLVDEAEPDVKNFDHFKEVDDVGRLGLLVHDGQVLLRVIQDHPDPVELDVLVVMHGSDCVSDDHVTLQPVEHFFLMVLKGVECGQLLLELAEHSDEVVRVSFLIVESGPDDEGR